MTHPQSLIELENQHIIRPDDLSIARPGLWPSEASVVYKIDDRYICRGTCMRSAFYRAMGIPEEEGRGRNSTNLMMKAHLGKAAEKQTTNRWKEMGIWVANSIKFYKQQYVVSGELDTVLNIGGKKVMVEQKSFYSFNASREICGDKGTKKRPATPGKPKWSHFLQTAIYADEYNNKVDENRIYYLERGDGKRVEYLVGVQDNIPYWQQIPGPYWTVYTGEIVLAPFTMDDIYARYKQLIKHLKEEKLPPRDYEYEWDKETIQWMFDHGEISESKCNSFLKGKERPGAWNCGYCSRLNKCLADGA